MWVNYPRLRTTVLHKYNSLLQNIFIQIGRSANRRPALDMIGRVSGLSGLFWLVMVVSVSLKLALLNENRYVGYDGDVPSRISLLRISRLKYATFKRSTEILLS